jgi:hypothetical protein
MRLFLASLLLLLVVPCTARAELAITEIAANPSLSEPGGEFVVVTNYGLAPVVLDGFRLTDAARSVRGVVPADTSVDPGQRIVLQPGAGAEAYACAPKPHRALLTAWAQLNNTGDTVILEAADGRELDRVTYDADAFAVEGPSRVWDRPRSRWTTSVGDATPCTVPPPRPGRFRFATAEVSAAEGAPSATLEVVRSGGTNGRVAVPWRAIDASATRGFDYSADAGTVTFAAGRERAALALPLLDDAKDEADESFTVVLGGDGVEVAEPTRAVVRIRDDDGPAPPVLVPPAPAMPLPSAPAPPATSPTTPPSPAPGPASAGTGPPAPAGLAAPEPPRASLQVAAWQRILTRRALTAVLRCSTTCHATVTGRVPLGRGRQARLATARRHLTPGVAQTLQLRLPTRYVNPLRKALRRRGSLRATITATPAGGAPTERAARIR